MRQGKGSDGGSSRRAASLRLRGSLSPVHETRVAVSSGGSELSPLGDDWESPEAFKAAVALFCDVARRLRDGQRVPRGVKAAASASAWPHKTEALRLEVRDSQGYFLQASIPVLARAMSVVADCIVAFDLFLKKVERLRQVAVLPPPPVCFEAGAILGRRDTRDEEDEKEPPRNMRRHSSSVDGDGRGRGRGSGGVVEDRGGRVLCLLYLTLVTAVSRRQGMLWRCFLNLSRSWAAFNWTERVWLVWRC